ncbi:MAG: phytanoyl-CoA dioxygenase family protein [bacterium]|nr:phytanoyl-CoA dioxygenase family protein [bacterium]
MNNQSVKHSVSTQVLKSYFKTRSWFPLWLHVLNRKPRHLWRRDNVALTALQERIVRDLQKTGIAITHVDELLADKHVLPALQQYAAQLRKDAKAARPNKQFLQYMWDSIPPIDLKNPFVQFSLDPAIVDVANAYMGMYAHFFYSTLNITTPMPPEAQAMASQRWHRDPEDTKMCKIFLYLNDVDETAGPFCYLPQSAAGLRFGSLFPQQQPLGFYPADDEVKRAIDDKMVMKCVGRAGTLVFCNTAGLHYGGYATQKERIMYTGGFRSRASVTHSQVTYPAGLDKDVRARGLTPAVQYAVTPSSPSRASLALFGAYKRRGLRNLAKGM